ncbi:MAG: hypothetical protein AAF267_07815 [Deinococcota bacterium]
MYTILVVLVSLILFGFPAGCRTLLQDVNLPELGGEIEVLEHLPKTSSGLGLEADISIE